MTLPAGRSLRSILFEQNVSRSVLDDMDAKSQLEAMQQKALLGGGETQIEKQHAKGKQTARERIEQLLDKDTFCETDRYITHRATGFGMEKNHPLTDGVVTGWGKINGRTVYVFAQDFTILGGSLGEATDARLLKSWIWLTRMALR